MAYHRPTGTFIWCDPERRADNDGTGRCLMTDERVICEHGGIGCIVDHVAIDAGVTPDSRNLRATESRVYPPRTRLPRLRAWLGW